jgi:sugar phosphate isomerase/epimerase
MYRLVHWRAMKTSIATVCISGTLVEKLHACATAGFDGVEIFEPDWSDIGTNLDDYVGAWKSATGS